MFRKCLVHAYIKIAFAQSSRASAACDEHVPRSPSLPAEEFFAQRCPFRALTQDHNLRHDAASTDIEKRCRQVPERDAQQAQNKGVDT
jgi:hypothetical protein